MVFAQQDFQKEAASQKVEKEAFHEGSRNSCASGDMSLGFQSFDAAFARGDKKHLSPAGYDIEIVEKHHNQKLDAPSGTAIALADSINEAGDGTVLSMSMTEVRSEKKRDKKELGISAVPWRYNCWGTRSTLCRNR